MVWDIKYMEGVGKCRRGEVLEGDVVWVWSVR